VLQSDRRDRLRKALGDVCDRFPGLAPQDDAELVASDPGDRVRLSHDALHALSDLAQDPVTELVTEDVIARLELIDVGEKNGRDGSAFGEGGGALRLRLEEAPVGKACECIVGREVLELHGKLPEFGDVVRHAQHESSAVRQSAKGCRREVPDPRIAARSQDRVLAVIPASLQVVEAVSVESLDTGTSTESLLRPNSDRGHVLKRVAGALLPDLVDLDDLAVFGVHHHGERAFGYEPGQQRFALAERLESEVSFGRVDHHDESAESATCFVKERAAAAGHVPRRLTLGSYHQSHVPDNLPLVGPRERDLLGGKGRHAVRQEQAVVFRPAIRRQDLYSSGLNPPSDILIRASLYQRM